jgi:hypothetical protein
MELVSKLRWVLVVVVAFVLMVLLGWGLATIARNIFGSSTGTTTTTETVRTEPIDAMSVRYIVEGPVVSNPDHRRTTVEVTPTVVMMTVHSNYGQTVLVQKSYTNNSVAYENFIKSLDQSNATARIAGTTEEDDNSDVGICATGLRYIIEIGDFARRWTTSCDRDQGTAAGKMTTMRGLFKAQVPDFDDVLASVPLPAPRW